MKLTHIQVFVNKIHESIILFFVDVLFLKQILSFDILYVQIFI